MLRDLPAVSPLIVSKVHLTPKRRRHGIADKHRPDAVKPVNSIALKLQKVQCNTVENGLIAKTKGCKSNIDPVKVDVRSKAGQDVTP
eukprot:5561614-Amphidinium_carterae.1